MDTEFERNTTGARICHRSRDSQRRNFRVLLPVKPDIAFFFRKLAAHAASGDDGRPVAEFRIELDAALRDRFTRRDCCHLRETLQYQQIFFAEIVQRLESLGFRPAAELIRRGSGILQRPNTAIATADALPALFRVIAERAHQAQTGHRNPVQAVSFRQHPE
jgi:hypothetical protein